MINAKLSYVELDAALATQDGDGLLALLDSPSIKIGDTASSLLGRRNAFDSVFDALCGRRIRTAFGRLRALRTLLLPAREYPKSFHACIHLLHDRSGVVFDEALWGLCLWCDPRCLPELERISDGRRRERVTLAIRAIQAGDYHIYSPYFDDRGAWSRSPPHVA
jgi:hypothetical protein